MMRYQNTKTGAIIETSCKVSGENWRELPPAGAPPEKKQPKKARVKGK